MPFAVGDLRHSHTANVMSKRQRRASKLQGREARRISPCKDGTKGAPGLIDVVGATSRSWRSQRWRALLTCGQAFVFQKSSQAAGVQLVHTDDGIVIIRDGRQGCASVCADRSSSAEIVQESAKSEMGALGASRCLAHVTNIGEET